VCTYLTKHLAVDGSGKGAAGWVRVTAASVYFDHPAHTPADHTLNVDLLSPDLGPAARVALELEPRSARQLAEAILELLAADPVVRTS
jgi:hypothetical protein